MRSGASALLAGSAAVTLAVIASASAASRLPAKKHSRRLSGRRAPWKRLTSSMLAFETAACSDGSQI
jgi:hypothetical protein